jgi:hypothetical protein
MISDEQDSVAQEYLLNLLGMAKAEWVKLDLGCFGMAIRLGMDDAEWCKKKIKLGLSYFAMARPANALVLLPVSLFACFRFWSISNFALCAAVTEDLATLPAVMLAHRQTKLSLASEAMRDVTVGHPSLSSFLVCVLRNQNTRIFKLLLCLK